MLHTLEASDDDRVGAILSTSRLNNFETLDFKHYLAIYPAGTGRNVLTGDCVPMGRRDSLSVEATDIPVQLNPVTWNRRKTLKAKVVALVRNMERRYLAQYLIRPPGGVRTRVARKVYDSFHFFRRSFRVDGYPGEVAVALATAFEVLLTDNYTRGVDAKIQEHLELALRGVPGTRAMRASVEQLYTARSQVVHDGRTNIEVDYQQARLAYVHAALRLDSLWDKMPAGVADPIGQALRQA